jgi:Ca2+-binding EF-hand superfamily protein
MKIFSIFAVSLFTLALTTPSFAQDDIELTDLRRNLFLIASVSFVQDPAPRQDAPARGRRRGEGGRLKQMDTNNDGDISRDEWQGRPEAFDKLDKNKDGKISREEFAQARSERAEHFLKEMDSNKDGQITRDEWKGNPEVFKRLDANNDGVVTQEELQARKQHGRRHKGETE